MEIPCAEKQPVQFAGGEYIRIGTNKKNIKEYPDKKRISFFLSYRTAWERDPPDNRKTLKSRIFKGLTIRNPAFLTHSSPGGEKIIFMQLLLVYHNLPRLSRGGLDIHFPFRTMHFFLNILFTTHPVANIRKSALQHFSR